MSLALRTNFKSKREYLRRYGKFLVSEYEKSIADNLVRPYTPMRYVSQDEITGMVETFPGLIYVSSWKNMYEKMMRYCPENSRIKYQSQSDKYPNKVAIKIIRENTVRGDCYEYVFEPGYYRVEINTEPRPYFLTACARGIPISTGWGRMSWLENEFNQEWRDRVNYWKWNKWQRKTKEMEIEERRKIILLMTEKHEAKQFFQAVAMASAVGTQDGM